MLYAVHKLTNSFVIVHYMIKRTTVEVPLFVNVDGLSNVYTVIVFYSIG